jgi:hypothetical protein
MQEISDEKSFSWNLLFFLKEGYEKLSLSGNLFCLHPIIPRSSRSHEPTSLIKLFSVNKAGDERYN